MRSALALTLATAMLGGGCFPHSAKNRAIAEIAEGALLAGGVVLEATVTTTADCQAMVSPGPGCGANGTRNGGIGVAMILTSLVAFIATISSAEIESTVPIITNSAPPPLVPPPSMPAPAPAPAPLPAPVPAPTPSGSAASLMSF
ncbi:MAG TPA: hypothetical protein VGG74_28035 [Kofleriaceae bacterium]|jgi:hypothetical protein